MKLFSFKKKKPVNTNSSTSVIEVADDKMPSDDDINLAAIELAMYRIGTVYKYDGNLKGLLIGIEYIMNSIRYTFIGLSNFYEERRVMYPLEDANNKVLTPLYKYDVHKDSPLFDLITSEDQLADLDEMALAAEANHEFGSSDIDGLVLGYVVEDIRTKPYISVLMRCDNEEESAYEYIDAISKIDLGKKISSSLNKRSVDAPSKDETLDSSVLGTYGRVAGDEVKVIGVYNTNKGVYVNYMRPTDDTLSVIAIESFNTDLPRVKRNAQLDLAYRATQTTLTTVKHKFPINNTYTYGEGLVKVIGYGIMKHYASQGIMIKVIGTDLVRLVGQSELHAISATRPKKEVPEALSSLPGGPTPYVRTNPKDTMEGEFSKDNANGGIIDV